MPFPVVAAVAAGAALGSSGFNAWSQGKMNKKTRGWNEKMYGKQREDALTDWRMQNEYNEGIWNRDNEYMEGLWNKQNAYQEKIWHMMNEYDSPAAQMQRFKDAGLNPNLIYGQQSTGGTLHMSDHDTTRQQGSELRSPGVLGWNPRALNLDMSDGILSYLNAEEKQANINNLQKIGKVYEQDAALRAAQISDTIGKTAKNKFELDLASDLRQNSVDAANASLQQTLVNTDIALRRNEREAAMNASNLAEAAERIATMRGQRINQALDAQLKSLDLNLKSIGVQPGDNMFIRILGQIFSDQIHDGTKKLNWIMNTD